MSTSYHSVNVPSESKDVVHEAREQLSNELGFDVSQGKAIARLCREYVETEPGHDSS